MKGFFEGCRPIIGLDACFLKGPFGGQLMAAIGRDGNNQMFPLAMAVVECECKESWTWFLDMLLSAFGNVDLMRCTFISDRQKDLIDSFQAVMPYTKHRFCIKALEFEPFLAADGIWEVTLRSLSWLVNLQNKTCSYREWDLTGIPCSHATCAILAKHKEIEEHVDPYYSVENFKIAYSFIVNPIPDQSQWSVYSDEDFQAIHRPPFKKLPGRLKKLRRKGVDEVDIDGRVTRKGIVQSCSNCGDTSHNRRRCKKPPTKRQSIPNKMQKANTRLGSALFSSQSSSNSWNVTTDCGDSSNHT
ncbi:UNVERIFIED_CONTAM: hypothetical protein Sradi_5076900 [Sesamum radiatum]|uniref:Zinc finger PMZ-type domain-containing protein n=1 Tax=Sesamum radiatum TaxID=300843 RepID=A0AAW2M504_SESRA